MSGLFCQSFSFLHLSLLSLHLFFFSIESRQIIFGRLFDFKFHCKKSPATFTLLQKP